MRKYILLFILILNFGEISLLNLISKSVFIVLG